jgi:hypothetical protein
MGREPKTLEWPKKAFKPIREFHWARCQRKEPGVKDEKEKPQTHPESHRDPFPGYGKQSPFPKDGAFRQEEVYSRSEKNEDNDRAGSLDDHPEGNS